MGVAGLCLALRVAGPSVASTRLGHVSLEVRPALGGNVDTFIPLANWGVRAEAFRAPLHLHVEPRSVNRQAVIRGAGGDSSVLHDARDDAQDAAASTLKRAAIVGLIGSALASALAAVIAFLWRRRLRSAFTWLALPPVLTGALVALVLVRVSTTFDASAFDNPTFYGRGAELAQLLKVADKAQAEAGAYRSSVDRTLSGYASLIGAGSRIEARAAAVSAPLVSDLHGNALVFPALGRVAGGQPMFFAGDLGQSGTQAEADSLVPRLRRLGNPLVAVSGNHDSSLLMRRLAAAGAVVLTRDGRLRADGSTRAPVVQRVAGLTVAGFDDPLEARTGDPGDPKRIFSFSELPDGDARFKQAEQDLIEWFRGLEPRPRVVLVHQNGLAQGLARAVAPGSQDPLLILTGHDHEQHVDIYGSTVVADAGTAGAGGIFGAGKDAIGIALLHFETGRGLPRAIDLVRFEPLSGSARAARVVPESATACAVDGVTCHKPPQ